MAGGYLPIICRRGNQDTNAWIGAWDVAAAKVVSLWPMWSNPKCRWCTLHASISLGNQQRAIAISWQLFKGGYGAGSGPYDMTLQKSVLAADNQITVTSAWDPAWGRPPAGWTSGVPTSPEVDHFLMTAEAGDVFTIQNQEYGVITGKQINANSITYTVQRGASYLDLGSCSQNPSICPKAWPAGTSIRMLGNGGGNLVWKISNPQAFGAGYLSGSGGHDMGSGKYYITSGHNIFYAPGGLADPANWLKQPIMTDMESPLFAGADPGSTGDTVESHPTYSQGDGPGPNQNWFADLRPFMGIYGGASQLIAGSDLYKVTSIGTVPLNEKKLEPFGVSAYTPLLNISGANSVINSGAQDNNKFCIADKPGECRSGSAAGDIFVNSAGVQLLTCSGTNSGPFPGKDICVVPQSMTGQAIVQYGITGTLGATIRDTADSLVRVLTTEFLGYRQLPGTGGVKVLSDGSWVLHSYSPDRQFMMIKTPPWPVTASSVARNDFIQIPVTITPPAIAGLDNVVVAFGYAENGGASRLQCTGRQESCFKGAQPATDYGFGNASAPGVRCAGTCTIYVPGLPGQLIYVQVKYRDAGKNIIGQGPIQVGPVDTQGPFVSVTVAEAPNRIFNVTSESGPNARTMIVRCVTDKTANTLLNYGTGPQYGSSASDSKFVTQHSVTLSALLPNQLYHFQIQAKDSQGVTATSADYTFTTPAETPVAAVSGTALFLRLDASTQGSWKNVYGSEGKNVIEDNVAYPAYVTVSPSGTSSYTWTGSSTDVRATQKVSSATGRLAACWYSAKSFSIDLNFSDANTHQVAFYALDWDNYQRIQRFDILDGNNNVLDTRTISSFRGGQYVLWNFSGHVIYSNYEYRHI